MRAREIGDRQLEFLSAGGVGTGHLELGDPDAARTWFDRAAEIASESPTPPRARQLELWRGLAENDVEETRKHLEHAVELAARQGMPAERCETLARRRSPSSLRSELADEELLAAAERAATDAKELLPLLPGHAPWGARADAALARVALARATPSSPRPPRAAAAALQGARHRGHEPRRAAPDRRDGRGRRQRRRARRDRRAHR